jgi:hypothetical protein
MLFGTTDADRVSVVGSHRSRAVNRGSANLCFNTSLCSRSVQLYARPQMSDTGQHQRTISTIGSRSALWTDDRIWMRISCGVVRVNVRLLRRLPPVGYANASSSCKLNESNNRQASLNLATDLALVSGSGIFNRSFITNSNYVEYLAN